MWFAWLRLINTFLDEIYRIIKEMLKEKTLGKEKFTLKENL
jgi:hypothetical protein